ncbi:Peptidyl-prolyl cis-trans isomerase D [Pseudovibrio axinellae]|uniref:Parvulin-like PPIase n=1 Tax=Pseudovibrio axinellae TaxID=989403 RepID=A0A166B5B9_9HYPH|nr:SurA N-terminal domain-containing protein [Pseudovibrio axinellae]KZL21903.1 Peptidyl-prolyl cis-trans isomerase D [Pseudovibrio axinellae]SEQ83127.1 peptidyl-prolyl cis-trans isomerase D [Pseudovibrio axinellae]
MLDALRNSVGSWFAKLLIALLVLSFAVWGIADVFTGIGSTSVASVGDKEISAEEFQRAYSRELDQLSRRVGQPVTQEQAAAFGVPAQVLGRLIAEAALDNEASKLRIGVSDEAIIKTIQETPAFQGVNGYDRNRLSQVLYNLGMNEDEFVMQQQLVAERQQLAEAIIGGIKVPQTMLETFDKYAMEERRVEYFILPQSSLTDVPAPTNEELTAFFESNKGNYKAPEYRNAAIIELTADKIANPDNITDQEIAQEYERTKNRYQSGEQRRIYQISFPTKQEAETAVVQMESGKTFEDLMNEQGLTEKDVDLGLMNKAGFLDQKIADAAFALKEDQTSNVVEGQFTNAILFAKEIKPAAVQPLDEVKDEIRASLAQQNAADEVEDLYNEIEDARAGGSTFEEIAERFNLDLTTTPAFDASGKNEAGETVDLPEANALTTAVFSTDIGVENDPLEIGRSGHLWYEVKEVTPSRDRELSEVKEAVTADLMAARNAELLEEKAKALVTEIKAGKSLSEIAAAEGLTTNTSEPFTRNGGAANLSGAAVSAAFSGPKGTATQVPGNNEDRILLVLTDTTTPAFMTDSENVKRIDTQMTGALESSLLNQFIAQLEQTEGVRVNQSVFNQLTGLNR